jgi:peptide/nickel transport system substrate-binding protein
VKNAVASVDKVDNYTVVFKLTGSNPRFHLDINVFSAGVEHFNIPIVPKHIWENVDPLTYKNLDHIATGPYRWIKAQSDIIIYERRNDWWATELYHVRPGPKYIEYIYYGAAESGAMKLIANEMDMGHNILAGVLKTTMDKNAYVRAWSRTSPYGFVESASRGIYINHLKYPWNITAACKALSLLIDRNAVCTIALEGQTVPGTTLPITPYFVYVNQVQNIINKYAYWEYNVTKATAIFTSLGFAKGTDGIWVTPNGTRLAFTLEFYQEIADLNPAMPVVAQQLRAGGIDCVSKPVLGSNLLPRLKSGNFIAVGWWLPGYADPYQMFNVYNGQYWTPLGTDITTMNYGRFRNSTFDQLVASLNPLSIADNKDQYISIVGQLADIWYGQVAAIPLWHVYMNEAMNTYYWQGWATKEDPWCFEELMWREIVCGYPSPLVNGTWVHGLYARTIDYATTYFTKDTPKYRGVDLIWYGPFTKGDAARIPSDDSEYWISKGYASYTAPAPVINTEGLTGAINTLGDKINALSAKIDSLETQGSNMTTIVYVESFAIVVLAISMIVLILKRK